MKHLTGLLLLIGTALGAQAQHDHHMPAKKDTVPAKDTSMHAGHDMHKGMICMKGTT